MTTPALPPITRAQLLLGAALGLLGVGFYLGWQARAPQAVSPEVHAHEQAAQALDQEAAARRPLLEEARRETGDLERRVDDARALAHLPAVVPGLAAPDRALDPGVLALVSAQDQLIAAQRRRIDLLESQLRTVEAAGDHRRAEVALLTPRDFPRPWAVGAVWAPPQAGRAPKLGALAHRQLGPAFVQVQAFKDQVAVAAGWRF